MMVPAASGTRKFTKNKVTFWCCEPHSNFNAYTSDLHAVTMDICPTVAPRTVSQHGRNQTHAPAARLQFASLQRICELPASQELHKGSKQMVITGHYIKTIQRVDHVLPNCPNQSQVLLAIWCPVILISLDPLTTTWLKSNLQKTPTWSKLSPPGYRHFDNCIWTRCNITQRYLLL